MRHLIPLALLFILACENGAGITSPSPYVNFSGVYQADLSAVPGGRVDLNRPTTCYGQEERTYITDLHVVFHDEAKDPSAWGRWAHVVRMETESGRCWSDYVRWGEHLATADHIFVRPDDFSVYLWGNFAREPMTGSFRAFGNDHTIPFAESDTTGVVERAATAPGLP